MIKGYAIKGLIIYTGVHHFCCASTPRFDPSLIYDPRCDWNNVKKVARGTALNQVMLAPAIDCESQAAACDTEM